MDWNWKYAVALVLVVFVALAFFASEGNDENGLSEKDALVGEDKSIQELEDLAPEDVEELDLEDWQLKKSPSCDEREAGVARDYCYRDIALAEENGSYCESIEDAYTKLDCISGIASVSEDSTICYRLAKEDQRYCFYSVATYMDNPFVCRNIGIEANKQGCYRAVLRNFVSLEVCNKLGELEQLCDEVDEDITQDCLNRLEECRSEDVI